MKGRVLVVDDNRLTRTLLADIVVELGYDAAVCASAREALQRLEEELPLVLVVDQVMPEVSGAELVRRIRGSPDAAVRALPIIGMSSRESAALAAAGADLTLTKPVSRAMLEASLQRVLGRGGPPPA